jgi:hypothetical protein
VQAAHDLAERGPEHALERLRSGSDDVDGDPALAERSGDLEADEARADHDHALRAAAARATSAWLSAKLRR